MSKRNCGSPNSKAPARSDTFTAKNRRLSSTAARNLPSSFCRRECLDIDLVPAVLARSVREPAYVRRELRLDVWKRRLYDDLRCAIACGRHDVDVLIPSRCHLEVKNPLAVSGDLVRTVDVVL